MIAAREDLDDRIAAELLLRLLQEASRSVEIERVLAAHVDVQFPGELGAERLPVLFENQADVVALPRLGDLQIDAAGVAIPQRHRLAVFALGAEDGLERKE